MALWWQEWKGLTVQKGPRGLWQGLTEVSAASAVHSDLRNWLISFSSKGAQEILSYSSAKVNYKYPLEEFPTCPVLCRPNEPCAPQGEIWQSWLLPALLTTQRALWQTAPRCSILSSWGLLPLLHLTLKQKLSIVTSIYQLSIVTKETSKLTPKDRGEKHVSL